MVAGIDEGDKANNDVAPLPELTKAGLLRAGDGVIWAGRLGAPATTTVVGVDEAVVGTTAPLWVPVEPLAAEGVGAELGLVEGADGEPDDGVAKLVPVAGVPMAKESVVGGETAGGVVAAALGVADVAGVETGATTGAAVAGALGVDGAATGLAGATALAGATGVEGATATAGLVTTTVAVTITGAVTTTGEAATLDEAADPDAGTVADDPAAKAAPGNTASIKAKAAIVVAPATPIRAGAHLRRTKPATRSSFAA